MIAFFRHGHTIQRARRYQHEVHNAPELVATAVWSTPTIYWFGAGAYFLQSNGIWISNRARTVGKTTQLRFFNHEQAFALRYTVNGELLLENELVHLGLPVATVYTGISEAQCQGLARLAQAWQFAWTWSHHKMRFGKDFFVFNAPFLARPLHYRAGD